MAHHSRRNRLSTVDESLADRAYSRLVAGAALDADRLPGGSVRLVRHNRGRGRNARRPVGSSHVRHRPLTNFSRELDELC